MFFRREHRVFDLVKLEATHISARFRSLAELKIRRFVAQDFHKRANLIAQCRGATFVEKTNDVLHLSFAVFQFVARVLEGLFCKGSLKHK